MFKVTFTRTLDRTDELSRAVDRAADALVDSTTKQIASRAAELAPKRTGYMASRFQVVGDDPKSKQVGNDADYFLHVETGTHLMGAQPSLQPAAAQEQAEFTIKATEEFALAMR